MSGKKSKHEKRKFKNTLADIEEELDQPQEETRKID